MILMRMIPTRMIPTRMILMTASSDPVHNSRLSSPPWLLLPSEKEEQTHKINSRPKNGDTCRQCVTIPKIRNETESETKKWHSNTWGDKRIAIHSPHVLPVDWPEAKFFLKECSPNPSFRPIPFGIVTQLKPSQQDHIWHKIYESMYICPHLLKSKHAEKFSRRKRWLSVPLTVTGQFPHLLFPQIPFLNSDVVDRALWIDIDPSWYAYWMAIIEWQLSNGKNGNKEMAWT